MRAPASRDRSRPPASPPESSLRAGRRPDTRRPATSADSFDRPTARAAAGIRHAALRLRRGLRSVLAASLLSLSLLAGLTTGALAQTVSISAPADANEGNTGTRNIEFSLSHSGTTPTDNVAVRICYTGTAALSTSDLDFSTGSDYRENTVVNLQAGCIERALGLSYNNPQSNFLVVRGDTTAEPDETIIATVSFVGTPGSTWSLGTSTATHTIQNDDPIIASLVATSDVTFTEQTPSDTAAVTVRLSRRLYAGEQLLVPIEILGQSGVRGHPDSSPSYTLSVSGNGAAVTSLTSDPFYVRFTGHDTDIVQEATFTLTPTNNGDADEANGDLILVIPNLASGEWTSSFTNVRGGGAPHGTNDEVQLTYADDDGVQGAALAFSASVLGAMEGGSTSYTVRLGAAPSGDVTVSLASDNTDVTVSPTSLTFTTVNWRTARTVTVNAAADADAVDDIASIVHSASGGGYTGVSGTVPLLVTEMGVDLSRCIVTTGSLRYPGCVWITGGDPVTEGQDATFTVHAFPPPSSALPVRFAVTDATEGHADFLAYRDKGRKTLTIPAGMTSMTWTVPTWDDSTDEVDGHIQARLFSKHNGAGFQYHSPSPREAQVLVRDNDGAPPAHVPPAVSLSVTPASGTVAKGESVLVCVTVDDFTKHTPPAHQPDQFYAGLDIKTSGGDVVLDAAMGFTAGQTERVCTTIDTARWPGETLTVRVPVAGDRFHLGRNIKPYVPGATPTATITVGGSPTGLSFGIGSFMVGEFMLDPENPTDHEGNIRTVNQRVYLGVDIVPAATSSFTLSFDLDGTATRGTDYDLLSPASRSGGRGTIAVPAGASRVTIPVEIVDDTIEDDGETIIVRLRSSGGYSVASPSLVVVTTRNDDPDAPPGTPEIAIAAGDAVTEGGDAVFTLTATPAPTADLPVSVTVATDGDYGVTAGTRSVTIPTTGSATLTLTTAGDEQDEADGSVSVTVTDGDGYTVGSSASGSVTVTDDDEAGGPDYTDYQTVVNYLIQVRDNPENTAVKGNPAHIAKWNRVLAAIGHDSPEQPMAASEIHANADKWPDSPFKAASVYLKSQEQDPDEPEITVSAGSAVTEGGDATFTITATPPPAADLPVSVTVATDGDYGVTAGTQTVTIPTTGSYTLTLTTTGDGTDEPDGSVTVTVTDGEGYTVGSSASGSVTVQDDDGETSPDYTEYQTVVNYLIQVRDHPENTAVKGNPVHIAKWNRVLAAIGHASPEPPMAASEIHANAAKWPDSPFKPASVYLESLDAQDQQQDQQSQQSQQDQQQEPDEPEITVSAGSAVTEGGDATFTITATPAPTSPLAVDVSVTTDGAYGVTAGTQTVTLPTTGSFTLELTTTDDATDEPDGSVSVTVTDGNGYTAGDPASGTVAVHDDDLPPPVVTVTAGNAATEGGNAVFTLTADRAPAADLTLTLSVAETGAGDHVAAADEGPATAVIAKDATEAVFTVATVNDEVDEPDGAAVVTVQAGEGYTVGDPASGTVTVKDDDVATLAVLSVADETVREGVDWLMTFTVRLSAPAAQAVEVRVDTRPSTPVSARTPADYWPLEGTVVRFPAGETEQAVQVLVYDDNHDEDPETFEFVLSDATGATIGDGVAVGTIVNNDSMPAAFLARFGRTLAQQTLDGIAGRLAAPRTPGLQGTLAGNPLNIEPAGGGDDASTGMLARVLAGILQGVGGPDGPDEFLTPLDDDPRRGARQASPRRLTAREALLGSRFTLTSQPDAAGSSVGFWGRAAQGYFDGVARGNGTPTTLDGTVTTGLLGADYARGPWLLGVALTQSTATGTYATLGGPACDPAAAGCAEAMAAGTSQTETALTAAIPYAALQVSERLQLWGAGGYGAGDVTLKTRGARMEADTTWAMAAAGLRGALLAPTAGADGPAVALTSDALWTRTASNRTSELAASASQVTRLRLGLAGSWRLAVGSAPADAGPGGSLTPKLELGARHDGGDAETGLGIELGGGVLWVEPTLGLSLDLAGRTLLAHQNDDLEDQGFSAALAFDPTPATPRGPSLHLRQDVGSPATGGLDALFTDAPLATRTGQAALSRWALEAAYGLPAFGGAFTGSPYVGVGLAPSARSYHLGWRLAPETTRAPTLTVDLTATRQERDAAPPVHTLQVGVTAQW